MMFSWIAQLIFFISTRVLLAEIKVSLPNNFEVLDPFVTQHLSVLYKINFAVMNACVSNVVVVLAIAIPLLNL